MRLRRPRTAVARRRAASTRAPTGRQRSRPARRPSSRPARAAAGRRARSSSRRRSTVPKPITEAASGPGTMSCDLLAGRLQGLDLSAHPHVQWREDHDLVGVGRQVHVDERRHAAVDPGPADRADRWEQVGTAALAATACSSGAPHPASMTTVEPSVASTAVTSSRSDHSTAGAMYVRIAWRNACSCGVRAARAIDPKRRSADRRPARSHGRPSAACRGAARWPGRVRTIASAVRPRSQALGPSRAAGAGPRLIAASSPRARPSPGPARGPRGRTGASRARTSARGPGRQGSVRRRSRRPMSRRPATSRAPGRPASSSPRSTPSSQAMPAIPHRRGRARGRRVHHRRSARRPSRCPGRRRCTSSPGRSGRRSARSSWTSIVTSRPPLMPSGWPEGDRAAVGVDLPGSRPSSSMHAIDCEANASFSSTTSRSSTERPARDERFARRRHRPDAHDRRVDARDRRRHDARHRPQPQLARPIRRDQQRHRRTVVDARAVPGRDRPAVRKAGLSLRQRLSASSRPAGCSSRVTTVASPFGCGTVTGTSWSSNRPASIACTARRWLSARTHPGARDRRATARRRSRPSRPSSTGGAARRASG